VVLCALLALVCLLGCQSLLGDFEIDDTTPGGDSCEGSFRCSESWLYCENESDGTWAQIDSCGTPDQCDSSLGRCTVCESGDHRCNGAKLETCKADRTGWTVVQTCATADECNLNSRSCRACTPGEPPMCAGADQTELRQCGEDQTWQTRDTCATKELCAATVEAAANPSWDGSCAEPGCPAAGAYVCDGQNLLRCPPSLTGYVLVDTCATEELCASTAADPTLADAVGGKCVMPVCSPAGAYRCVEEVLEQCLEDQLGWGLVEICAFPFQCNTNEQACAGPCQPGDRQCNGATLELCGPSQLWEQEQVCVSGPLCQVAEDPLTGEWTGSCTEPACSEPGVFRCTEGVLEVCSPDQTEWRVEDTCASAALCDATDGRCEPPRCEFGALRCSAENASELLRCRDDLTDWEPAAICSSTQSCNTDPAGPPCLDQCPDPPLRCNGAARESCSGVTGMPVWTTETTCRSRELCQCAIDGDCPEGTLPTEARCGAPVCGELLGGSRCAGSAGSVLQLCLQGRNGFDEGVECGVGLCVPGPPANPGPWSDGGYCAVCSVGSEKNCSGTSLRTCSADRRTWASTTPCGALGCRENGTSDYCNECTDGEKRCSGNGNNMGLQTCSQGRWGAPAMCGAPGRCVDSGSNDYCAVCTANERQCVTGGIQTCTMQGQWGATAACAPGLGCMNSGTADYCIECTGTERRCSDDALQSCAQGRWGTPADCALGCFDATGNTDYCAECTGTERRCSADDEGLESCTQERWGDAVACTLGCHDGAGTADYCAECTGSETRCSSGDLQTCTAERWGTAVDCPAGCVTTTGADYCAECTPGETACAEQTLRTCGTDSRWAEEACALACVEAAEAGEADYCATCETDEDCLDGGSCLLGRCEVL
jgi:hypothetical protein